MKFPVYEAAEEYKKNNAANDVHLLTEDPSLIWVIVAVAGAVIDVAALTAVFKVAKPIAEATKAFDEGADILKLQKDLAAITEISEHVKKNILLAAEARANARKMFQSMFQVDGMLKMVILPGGAEFAKLVATAYYIAKQGILNFHSFLLELKATRLIDDIAKLTDEERLILKNAFEKGQELTKADTYLAGEIDKAIAEGDFIKLKSLLDEVVQGAGSDLLSFVNKTLTQKLDDIKTIWNTKYPIPDMLGGRSFFEDVMGQYRYTKSTGWNHTGDISFNVKGIDFYKGTQQGIEIYASTAVSMKTTIKTNVDEWLRYQSIKDNIKFLDEGLSTKGLFDPNNSLKMFMTNAEIHIYMPKANITEALKTSWMNKLNTIGTKIKFEIKALEDFIQ